MHKILERYHVIHPLQNFFIVIDGEYKFVKDMVTKNNILLTAFVKCISNLGINRDVAIELREGKFVIPIALFDVAFQSKVGNLNGGIFGMHWEMFGNVD